jgi:parallel beta-helix repeat protein
MSGVTKQAWRLAVVLTVAVGSVSAHAAEGRIAIPFTSPPTTPITIVSGGAYVLTRNLAATGSGPVINIAIPVGAPTQLDLDLNGFLLDGATNPGSPVISISVAAGATLEARIHDGGIQGGSNAISLPVAGGAARKLVIERIRAANASAEAILMRDVQNLVVRDCVLIDGIGVAISNVSAGGLSRQATIERNQIRNTRGGILIQNGATAAIVNNQLDSIAGGGAVVDAILLDGCRGSLVADNTIRDVNGAGANGITLKISLGNRLSDNVIHKCTKHGISLDQNSNDNLIRNNLVSQAGTNGIVVSGTANQIEGNILNHNGCGLFFTNGSFGNVYSGNVSRESTSEVACPQTSACWIDFADSGGGNTSSGTNFLPSGVAPCN